MYPAAGQGKPAVPQTLGRGGTDQGLEEWEVPKYQPTPTMPWGQFYSQPGNYEAPGAPIKVFRCDSGVRSQAGFSSLLQLKYTFVLVLSVLPFSTSGIRSLAPHLPIPADHAQSNICIFHWRGQRAAAATWGRWGFQRRFTACTLADVLLQVDLSKNQVISPSIKTICLPECCSPVRKVPPQAFSGTS